MYAKKNNEIVLLPDKILGMHTFLEGFEAIRFASILWKIHRNDARAVNGICEMRFDTNRGSPRVRRMVAVQRHKFLIYFLSRLPAHFQPRQLQPSQHDDEYGDLPLIDPEIFYAKLLFQWRMLVKMGDKYFFLKDRPHSYENLSYVRKCDSFFRCI